MIDLTLCEEEMPEEEKNLPFRLLSPGIPQRVNSSFYNVKYIRAYNAYECEVNPEDAKRLGIKSGDKVRLNNQRGEAFFVAPRDDALSLRVWSARLSVTGKAPTIRSKHQYQFFDNRQADGHGWLFCLPLNQSEP